MTDTAYVLYSVHEKAKARTIIARPRRDGTWESVELNKQLPQRWQSWDLMMPGGGTIDRHGGFAVVAQLQRVTPDEPSWGHPSNEVACFRSTGGGLNFGFDLVSQVDDSTSHWLPNIEKPTGHHQVPDQPGVLYTAGQPGTKNTDLLSNGVYWTVF